MNFSLQALAPRPNLPRRHLLSLATLPLLGSLLAGCDGVPGMGKASFKSTDITGAPYGKDFSMTDHLGKPRTLADFKGKVTVMFFGFTFCPDICPSTLAAMREVIDKLGKDGDKVQVLFVTVDPERDTKEKLALYVPAFHPSFIGLVGDAAATARIAKDYLVVYQKEPGKTPDTYTISHTSNSFVYDMQGRVRLILRHGQPVDQIVADLRQLIAGK
jgi:protein SCO1